ncbi:MAG: hypothetical protein ACFB10_17335, partial [Salibacteraceae bacterium]
FVCSPVLRRASVVVMSDLLGLMGIIGFWRAVLAYRSDASIGALILAVLAALLAVFSRYPAALVIGVLGIGWAVELLRKKDWSALFLLGIGGGGLSLLVLFLMPGLVGVSENSFLQMWSATQWWQTEFQNADGTLQFPLPNLLATLGVIWLPTFGLSAWLSIGFLKRTDLQLPDRWVLLLALLVKVLFLAGLPFQNPRVVYLGYPLVLLLVAPGFVRLWNRFSINKVWRWGLLTGVVMVQLALLVRGYHQFYSNQQVQQLLAYRIKEREKEVPVYTFAVDQALDTYNVESPIYNLWRQKFDEFSLGGVVLFQPEKFGNANAPGNVWANWQTLTTHYQLRPLESLAEGWVIYRIERKEP